MKKKDSPLSSEEREIIKQENLIIEELTREDPEKLILSEVGTVIQDYIDAYFSHSDLAGKRATETYVSHLLFAIVKRLNKNSKTIN
jgi:hypothetical protein